MQYYSYRISIRDTFNPFLAVEKLTQQYFVDIYVKTEANRLNYVSQNQSQLRVEKYSELMEHLNRQAEERGLVLGKAIILPSSFQGSPRNMMQNYQDKTKRAIDCYYTAVTSLTTVARPRYPCAVQYSRREAAEAYYCKQYLSSYYNASVLHYKILTFLVPDKNNCLGRCFTSAEVTSLFR